MNEWPRLLGEITLLIHLEHHKLNKMNTKITNQNQSGEPKELSQNFVGKGQVKGFLFKQIEKSTEAYIYKVSDSFGNLGYEVFLRRIDARFGNISYPKANSFGITAWYARTLEKAYKRFEMISNGDAIAKPSIKK